MKNSVNLNSTKSIKLKQAVSKIFETACLIRIVIVVGLN